MAYTEFKIAGVQCLFFFFPLFLELVSGPSSSSAFCSASNMVSCIICIKKIKEKKNQCKWCFLFLRQKSYQNLEIQTKKFTSSRIGLSSRNRASARSKPSLRSSCEPIQFMSQKHQHINRCIHLQCSMFYLEIQWNWI